MTVTEEPAEPAAEQPWQPPPPPQVPARSAGPQRPQGSAPVSPTPVRASRPRVGRAALVGGVVLVTLFSGCGALLMSGGGDSASPTSTTVAPGVDEMIEVSPTVWYPELTPTARALIGDTREQRLLFAGKVKAIVEQVDPETRKPVANPCELWLSAYPGGVGAELTFQRHWTPAHPVPVFECAREEDGSYAPPVSASVPTPTASTVPNTAGGAAGAGKPAGE